jgi:hypothetical protein
VILDEIIKPKNAVCLIYQNRDVINLGECNIAMSAQIALIGVKRLLALRARQILYTWFHVFSAKARSLFGSTRLPARKLTPHPLN